MRLKKLKEEYLIVMLAIVTMLLAFLVVDDMSEIVDSQLCNVTENVCNYPRLNGYVCKVGEVRMEEVKYPCSFIGK